MSRTTEPEGRRNILIVDDDELYLDLVRTIAELADARAYCARNGEQATRILKEARIATLITDLNMPGMDGFQLAALAKRLSPDTRVVMITGDISPDVPRLAEGAGIATLIAKPCGADQIREVIRGTTKRLTGIGLDETEWIE